MMKSPLSLPSIRHIISVSSGKGGVGKSTVAFHLAHTLSKQGLSVGLLDADIYGPSLPTFIESNTPPAIKNNQFIPLSFGPLKIMSIGFLVDPKSPIIWRGLLIQKALRQLLEDVEWGNLDLLMIDMPPGTGDIPLTMHQWVPLSGGIIVSISDLLSWSDAYKGRQMLKKMNIPFMGYIENMSSLECPHCHQSIDLVQESFIEAEARKEGDTFLGSIPFERSFRFGTALSTKSANAFEFIGKKVQEFLTARS
jgi:ATP-binding protein involved in chromosome partitioning